MKNRYIFNGITVTAAILVLITIVMRFWGVDQLSLSALTLLQGLFVAESEFNLGDSEVMKALVFQIEILLISPYVAAIAMIVFGLLKQWWSYIVTAVLGLLEILFLLLDMFLLIPMELNSMLEDVKDTVVGLPYIGNIILEQAEEVIGLPASGTFQSVVTSGIGPAYWVCVVMFAIILVISVCAILIAGKEDADCSGSGARRQAAVVCLCGEMAGLKIPVETDDDLLVGSDARYCNLIISSSGVQNRHCQIRYLKQYNKYQVTDYSRTGTYLNEETRLEPGAATLVERGSRLELGNVQNVLFLE